MPRVLACPSCNASLPRGTKAGDHVTCGFCGNAVVVAPPAGVEAPPAAAPATPPHVLGSQSSSLGDPPRPLVIVDARRSGGRWLGRAIALVVLAAVAVPVVSALRSAGLTVAGVRSAVEDVVRGAVGDGSGGAAASGDAAVGAQAAAAAEDGDAPDVVFGGAGTGAGLLDDAFEIGVDGEGYVYVGEATSGRIQRFTREGEVSGQWLVDNPDGLPLSEMVVARDGTVVVALGFQLHRYRGATGEALGRVVVNPSAVLEFFGAAAPLPDGGLLVVQTDGAQPELVWLGPDLREVRRVAPPELTTTDTPERIAVDGQGTVYALGTRTTGGDRQTGVLVFDAAGAFRDFFPTAAGGVGFASGLAVDGRSRVAVGDGRAVGVFEPNGTPVDAIDLQATARGVSFDPADGRLWVTTGDEVRAYPAP